LVPCIVEGRSELRNIGRVNSRHIGPIFYWAAEHLTYLTYTSLAELSVPQSDQVELFRFEGSREEKGVLKGS
jgi:hypothetical protein